MNFVKITDHDWIGDEVVDYIGKTLMYGHNSSHIFSTQFMTNLLNDIFRLFSIFKIEPLGVFS